MAGDLRVTKADYLSIARTWDMGVFPVRLRVEAEIVLPSEYSRSFSSTETGGTVRLSLETTAFAPQSSGTTMSGSAGPKPGSA
jgi:hypothetical protein